jgi:hypothetical protein
VVAPAARMIKKIPVPESSKITLPKITASDQRRWVLIMRRSTTMEVSPKRRLVSCYIARPK